MSPPSQADADLSPAEEEIESPAADLKSDNRSEDDSDDSPSVWYQQDVYSLSTCHTQWKAETRTMITLFYYSWWGDTIKTRAHFVLLSDECNELGSVPALPSDGHQNSSISVSVNSSKRTIKSRADGFYLVQRQSAAAEITAVKSSLSPKHWGGGAGRSRPQQFAFTVYFCSAGSLSQWPPAAGPLGTSVNTYTRF